MWFTSPAWILALIPWAILTLWLLRGRPSVRSIPFLELWRDAPRQTRTSRAFRPPQLPIAATLLAILFAILAAAGPVLLNAAAPLTIIIDRGITMSPDGRLAALLDKTTAILRDANAQTIDVPDGAQQATALHTADDLHQAIRHALATTDTPVLVLSDQRLDIEHPRLFQIAPDKPLSNAGITHIAARATPHSQVHLRLRNQTTQYIANLRITTAGYATDHPIALPPIDEQRDYFFDLPVLGPTIEAELLLDDDLPADNRAYLARRRAWPIIEPRITLPPEIDRVLHAYNRARPSSDAPTRVIITTDLAATDPAVILAHAHVAIHARNIDALDHPVTANVNWPSLTDLRIASSAPRDWTVVASIDNHPIIAVRELPARQLWLGFTSAPFPATADFVILWTNILDWVGDGADIYDARPVHRLDPDFKPLTPIPTSAPGLWPALYQRDNHIIALNADSPEILPLPDTRPLPALLAAHSSAGLSLRLPLILVALALLLVCALTWLSRG